MTHVSSFNQSMDEYDKFNRLVAQFKDDLANDPTSILTGTSAAENELITIARNGADPDFSLIEGTAWMHQFGTSLTAAIDSVVGQVPTSTIALSHNDGSAKIVDQNGEPITSNILAEIAAGTVTSISFDTTQCFDISWNSVLFWNIPDSLKNLTGSSGVTTTQNGQGIPQDDGTVLYNLTVTVSGSALTTFINQALQNGELNMGGIDTSAISTMLAQFGF